MNPFDWVVVAILGITLLGAQLAPDSYQQELQAPAEAQVATGDAGLSVGGVVVARFADSGSVTAIERAISARQQLRRAISHHRLAERYHGFALRLSGGEVVQLHYMDLLVLTVTAADARLNGASSARELAERWKQALDAQLQDVPAPLPDAWVATTGGGGGGGAMVTESTLSRTVAGALSGAGGVRVEAAGSRVILSGIVASQAERQRVVALVREVPGVREVEDRMRLAE